MESFHIGIEIRGIDALQKIKDNMEAMTIDQAAKFERIEAKITANEAILVQERHQDQLRRNQDADERKREKEAEEARRAEERQQDELRREHKARQKKAQEARQLEERKQKQIIEERELMEKKLSPVLTARFDGNGEPKGCLPRTRGKLLRQISDWISDHNSPNVFCLTGLAGTGKTTIAQSVCIEFPSKTSLTSFLISRDSVDRRNPEKVIQMIAYQLGVQQVAIGTAICNAFHEDWDITTRPISEQVLRLFKAPIETLQMTASPILLVIDALDECNKVDECEGGDLIPLLASAIRQVSARIKLLITSREEPQIMRMFERIGVRNSESSIRL